MKTILFGGSFDPLHSGHIKVALKAMNTIHADRVVFVLAKYPRWKKPLASDEQRLEMLKLGIKDYPNFSICLDEINSTKEVNYTYETVRDFKKQDDEELYFLIGTDQEQKLDKWYEIEKLSSLVHFICVTRPGEELNKENLEKYHVDLIDSPVSDMSSTGLRELKNVDVPLDILDYIVKHELYYIPDIKNRLSEHRFKHSCSVARTAYIIALKNGLDVSKAYIAGLLHDIGKEVDIKIQYEEVKKSHPTIVDLIEPQLYHQFVGERMAREIFHIDDLDILLAIRYHATGNANMGTYGEIIYASDKIEPTRKYDSSELIKACEDNYHLGFIKVLEENIKFLKSKKADYTNPLTLACVNYYLGGNK
jgi:nicotinate-nucleotide adenylyltransferase